MASVTDRFYAWPWWPNIDRRRFPRWRWYLNVLLTIVWDSDNIWSVECQCKSSEWERRRNSVENCQWHERKETWSRPISEHRWSRLWYPRSAEDFQLLIIGAVEGWRYQWKYVLHVELRAIRKRACSIRNQGCWNVRDAYFSLKRMLPPLVLSLRWLKFSCDDRMTQLFSRRIHLPEMNACLDKCDWGIPRHKRCRHSRCRPIDWTRQRRRRVCARLASSYIVSLNG